MSAWTREKLKRYIKEGRGQGVGKDYKPWINTYEFSSKGRATRLFSKKTNRIHQLHSDNQYRAFLLFEFNESVIDIRESFPLLDVLEVIDDQDDLRFDRFVDKETGQPFVLTTNFLLTIKDRNGNERYVARSIENTTELNKKVTFERLEIERRYWLEKGIDWKVMTSKELPRQLAKNIEWVRETLFDEKSKSTEDAAARLYLLLKTNQHLILREALKLFDKIEGLDSGAALLLFRYLIATHQIQVDMFGKIDMSDKVENILLNEVS